MGHLEVETKHGHVLVFDHRAPAVYACPPAPEGTLGRSWQDLTERVPEAFDGRPVFAAVSLASHDGRPCWQFDLSTGAKLTFVLDPSSPLLLPVPGR